ncbi:MAG: hypothetical protein Q7S20_00055 [Gemmatimonadaceae bacterium]|nr:hypothetical protein [Gemmatimonadaceae bacterium]
MTAPLLIEVAPKSSLRHEHDQGSDRRRHSSSAGTMAVPVGRRPAF